MSTLLVTATVAQIATITNGPQLNDPNFQGWYINNGSEAIDCGSGSSLFTTKNFAQCCSIGSTCNDIVTKCVGTVRVGISSSACDTAAKCITMTIFNNYPVDDGLRWSQFICAANWPASSIYRTIKVPTTVISPTVYTTVVPAGASLSTATAPLTVTTPITVSSTGGSVAQQSAAQSSPAVADSSPPSSMAWIAGPVIGVLALLALGIFLFFFFKKRKAKAQPTYPYTPQPQWAQATDQRPQWAQDQRSELPDNATRVYEMGDPAKKATQQAPLELYA